MLNSLLVALICVITYMTLFWAVAQLKKDLSVVDFGWGGGFVFIAITLFFLTNEYTIRQIIVTSLVSIWGIRLSIYLYLRNKGTGEDYRYKNMRKRWTEQGKSVGLTSYIRVFMSQGLAMFLLSYPIVAVYAWDTGSSLGLLDYIGIVIWIIGFSLEVIADKQLSNFKQDKRNEGKIITSGVWKYSRHPNYFGESVLWWGIFLIVSSVTLGWTAVAAPALLTFLLIKVTGVPPLERKYMKKPEFRAYAKRTSMFIPWFPKKQING
ncbi:DUF1295 domain-containing protein [Bacillus solimangrovi]|uniref:Uncharacterized protein n=1 Tax=Bacillus solimangrovi TaxID=1305675 RepID=A0A1E5LG31_9BACI|nr:DUF1295 domain-containing protein [Bacillus solimangrovi]OEH93030.1 hypothetical protein BFG57_13825 [Bacillus solimangrovi]